jgi:High potential iron-sulfur protein
MHLQRRRFLIAGLQLPLLGVAVAARGACVDTEELSDSVASMRESLEYTDTAADPKQACNGCSFFKSEKPGASCGNCEVLGGPVSNKGHCVSWTKRG